MPKRKKAKSKYTKKRSTRAHNAKEANMAAEVDSMTNAIMDSRTNLAHEKGWTPRNNNPDSQRTKGIIAKNRLKEKLRKRKPKKHY